MLKFLYNTRYKYLNTNKQITELKKLQQKIFFLKVWAKNMGAHYTQEHVIHRKIQYVCTKVKMTFMSR